MPYYKALAVLDRIDENLPCSSCEFGRWLNGNPAAWYSKLDQANPPKVMQLIKYAEKLNLSYEYLLTGRNKQPYQPVHISLEKLLATRDNLKYKVKIPRRINSTLCFLRKGTTKDLQLKTLFELEELLHIPAYTLLTK